MSAKKKAKNTVRHAKGKVEEAAGKITGDHKLRVKGQAHQVEANLKQAGEKVKDAFKV
jgi:uncharacterized protein YjbJ (UPF0337 family)